MDKLKTEKLKMWQDKLAKLEKEHDEIMQKRGEAIAMGDLSENAAFKMADEDATTWRVRMDEIKNIIKGLEEGK